MLPLVIALGLLAIAAAVHLSGAHTRQPRGRTVEHDPGLTRWAEHVRNQLPRAFDALQVTAAGPLRNNRRPPIRVHGVGKPAGIGGWEWPIELPGAAVTEDINPERLAGAINSGGIVVDVIETQRTAAGWAFVRGYRNDPLSTPARIPWQPGTVPSCVSHGQVCIGLRRDGTHTHFDILKDGSAYATLIAGRRGSGKSETARLVVAQLCAWEHSAPIIVDLVRHGVDYAAFGPLLDRPPVTNLKEAAKLIEEINAEADARAAWMRERGIQKIYRPTEDMPLRLVVAEEIQSFNDDQKMKTGFRRWTQQARPVLGAPVMITQYPTVENVDSTTRAQVTNVWGGQVRNATEANVVFGSLPEGVGPQHLRTGAGSYVADTDHPELEVGRSWQMSPAWVDEHVARLEKKRATIRV